jgi:hypothetical protein
MSISFEQLKAEAAKLSEAERAELAHEMLKSLDAADDAAPEEIERSWLEECVRRDARLERGETHLIEGSEAIARLRQRLG